MLWLWKGPLTAHRPQPWQPSSVCLIVGASVSWREEEGNGKSVEEKLRENERGRRDGGDREGEDGARELGGKYKKNESERKREMEKGEEDFKDRT